MSLVEELRSRRLLAIVRGADAGAALATVVTLADCGITMIEVSLTAPHALETIRRARAELGADVVIGAGTVITAEDVERAGDAGAQYLVTPGIGPSLDAAVRRGLPVIAGVLTPSEVIRAGEGGAAAIKLFPASLGGPGYLRALRDPFPAVPFVPVGGVDASAARAYLQAGAVAVGVGSPLVGDAADGGDLGSLRVRARAFLAAVAP